MTRPKKAIELKDPMRKLFPAEVLREMRKVARTPRTRKPKGNDGYN